MVLWRFFLSLSSDFIIIFTTLQRIENQLVSFREQNRSRNGKLFYFSTVLKDKKIDKRDERK